MRRRAVRALGLAGALALVTGGCGVRSARDAGSGGAAAASAGRAAIEAQSRAFSAAYVRGDVPAMLEVYTEDAVIFPANRAAITGRPAIARYWTLPEGQHVTHHRADPADIVIDGVHAYDHGTYEVSGVRNGRAWGPTRGKYVIVWRREPAGWRMKLDMWNAGP